MSLVPVVALGLALAVALALLLRAQQAQKQAERRADAARRLNELANDPMLLADVGAGRILDANGAAAELLGYDREALLGKLLPELHPPELRGRSAEVIADVWERKGLVYSDLPFKRADGTLVPVEISARVIDHMDRPAVLIFARDIRERLEAETRIRQYAADLESTNRELKEAQAQLVRSAQMASLGNLAAGMAHEINNPIGAINANVDTARRAVERLRALTRDAVLADPKPAERAIETLDRLADANEQAGQRIAAIVGSLRNFARLDEAEQKRVDLHEGIDNAIALLTHRMGERIHVERHFGQVPPVLCAPGQLNQVFMNVLMNAIEAIDVDGTIDITTDYDGVAVNIAVEDSGRGIGEGDLERIFEPGFTTKGSGVGSGLGLSIAYRIVDEHAGNIRAERAQGGGTRILLRVPCVDASAPPSRRP